MIGLLFFAGWGGLLLLTFVLVIVFFSRPWHIGERIACTAMTLLIGLGIPFWDYIPAKMYFNDVCTSAGVKITTKSLSKINYNELRMETNTAAIDWNTREINTLITHSDRGQIAVLKTYYQDDGHGGFFKPWMVGRCPRPGSDEPRWVRAGDVVISQFKKILEQGK